MYQSQHTGGGISSSLVSSSLVVGGKPAAARLNHVKNQIEAFKFYLSRDRRRFSF